MASVASTALQGVRPMETIVTPEGETLAYFIPNYIPDKLQFLSPGQEVCLFSRALHLVGLNPTLSACSLTQNLRGTILSTLTFSLLWHVPVESSIWFHCLPQRTRDFSALSLSNRSGGYWNSR